MFHCELTALDLDDAGGSGGIAARLPGDRDEDLVSVLIWVMVGLAIWHFAVLVPDRFWGGIIGAFLAALLGAIASGYVLPAPGIPVDNPPGWSEALWPVPGLASRAERVLLLRGSPRALGG